MGIKESKLKDRQIKKLEKKTGFDQDEIQHWYAGFMKDSPTGEMQRSEFVQIYRELFPNGDATTFSNYIFNIIDKDASGSINFEEFLEVRFARLILKIIKKITNLIFKGTLSHIGPWYSREKARMGFWPLRFGQFGLNFARGNKGRL